MVIPTDTDSGQSLRALPLRSQARLTLLLIITAILLLGLFIRLWDLNRESFWADEGWTMLLAQGPTLGEVVRTMAADQHPPLYFMMLRPWMDVFGESEIMIRLFSTFLSVIGIGAVYRLAADQFGVGSGLAAALLLALMDNDIMLAREARHYAQMAAFAALSSLFYLRYLRRPGRANGIAWLLSSLGLMYTHYLGALLLAVQAVHILFSARPLRRTLDMFFRLGLIGVGWLPWALVFLNQSLVRYNQPRLFQSTLPNTPETFAIVRGDLIGSHYAFTFGLMLLGLVYIGYRGGAAQVRLRPLRPTAYLALWVIVPVATIILLNPRFPILTTRNFLIVTPGIVLLIGHGLMNLDRTARTFALIVLVVLGLFTVDAYHLKPPWREVSQDILQLRESDEPILMEVWVDDMALRYHLGRDLGVKPANLPLISMWEWREQYGEAFFPTLLEYLRDKPSLWLVYWGKNEGGLLEFLPTHGYVRVLEQIEHHREEQIFIWRYERPPAEAETVAQFSSVLKLRRAVPAASERSPGQPLRVNLLWEVLQPIPVDLSVSVFLLDSTGAPAGNDDHPPLSGNTSTWSVGGFYFDSHSLTAPATPGTYQIGVKVYWYADPQPLPVNGQDQMIIGSLTVR